jgi:hypothetical protein
LFAIRLKYKISGTGKVTSATDEVLTTNGAATEMKMKSGGVQDGAGVMFMTTR